jgi:uncharacterized iron-regulated protein
MAHQSRSSKPLLALLLGIAAASGSLAGCSLGRERGYYLTRPQAREPSDAVIPLQPSPPRSLAMFEGDTGRVATWADLMEGVAWAEVVFLGEIHDHVEGHLVQQAIVEDALASFPGVAVSMEMFERDDQPAVDAFLRGEIGVDELVERTKSLGWGASPFGETSEEERRAIWDANYQPVVDAAKLRGAPVIAANAPRSYVRRARTEGYDALRSLPAEERALFDLPGSLEDGVYRRAFDAVMLREGEDPNDPSVRTRIDNTYRSQQVWDTTMGRSIAAAFENREGSTPVTKVIHLVGGFHVDRRAGTVTRLLEARPGTRVLTIQVIPSDARRIADGDRGRADLVIYAERIESAEPKAEEQVDEGAAEEASSESNL